MRDPILDPLTPTERAMLARPHMGTRDPDPRVEQRLRERLEDLRKRAAANPGRQPTDLESLRDDARDLRPRDCWCPDSCACTNERACDGHRETDGAGAS